MIRQDMFDTITQPATATLDNRTKTRHKSRDTLIFKMHALIWPYITGSADTLFKQPPLIVKAMRIGVAMRASQAYCQSPALTGMHLAYLLLVIVSESQIP